MSYSDFILILSSAFLGSLSHCAGMCGGIVLALNMKATNKSKIIASFNNTLYFFGRMCGYIAIGLIFVLISKSFSFNNATKGAIFIVIGILLLLSVFGSVFFPNILAKMLPSGDYAWYKKLFIFFNTKFIGIDSIRFYSIGVLNAFLPCHLVYIFAIKAADTMSIKWAFLTMFLFSLGTFLPLFLIGLFSHSLLNSKIRKVFLWVSSIIILYFAFNNIMNGISTINNDSNIHNSNINHHHHHH